MLIQAIASLILFSESLLRKVATIWYSLSAAPELGNLDSHSIFVVSVSDHSRI